MNGARVERMVVIEVRGWLRRRVFGLGVGCVRGFVGCVAL